MGHTIIILNMYLKELEKKIISLRLGYERLFVKSKDSFEKCNTKGTNYIYEEFVSEKIVDSEEVEFLKSIIKKMEEDIKILSNN